MPVALQKPAAVAVLLVLAVAVQLHGNLTGPFYRIDDQRYVPHSTTGSLADVFKPKEGILYGPVTFLSLRFDRAVFGPPAEEVVQSIKLDSQRNPAAKRSWAWGPRLMNGVYHATAGFLLWLFFKRLGLGFNTAFFIAFVWTAHPVALESIAWVCERKNVLCALFGFAALAAWASEREWRFRWPLVWLFFALSLFSKLAALSFLPAIVALELFDPQRTDALRTPRFWVRLTLRMLPLLALSLLMFWLSMGLFKNDIAAPPGGTPFTGLLSDAEIFGRYSLNILLPLFSSFFYGLEPIVSLADPRFWLYGLALLALWSGLFFAAKPDERHWVIVGFLWFFGALGPNANIIATAFPMQDRYSYIPMPGLLLGFAIGMRGLFARLPQAERVLPIAAGVYMAFVLLMSGLRSSTFHNSDALTFDAIRRQPKSGYGMMMATHIFAADYSRQLALNPAQAGPAAEVLAAGYAAAEQTPDYWQFTSPIILRAERAEVLLFLGRDREAAEYLSPLLKPKAQMAPPLDWKTLYPDLPDGFRHRFRPKLDTAMMFRAWMSSGEAWLRVSMRRDTPGSERMSVARKALEHAERALEFEPENRQALMLLGRAQLRVSDLHAESNAMPEALRLYNLARETFSREPVKAQSEELLKKLVPPEAPKPKPPQAP